MQIRELTLPPNQKKIIYEITKNGKTLISTSELKPTKTPSQELDLSKIQLGQFNSIRMTHQNQLQNILEKNPFLPIKTAQKAKQQTDRAISCSCKKSKCLKMYCQCFAKKLFCGHECTCKGCTNTQVNATKLYIMRGELDLKKQPQDKGCKCQKSGCNKKYCECFSRKQKCTELCECLNCQNKDLQKIETKNQENFAK